MVSCPAVHSMRCSLASLVTMSTRRMPDASQSRIWSRYGSRKPGGFLRGDGLDFDDKARQIVICRGRTVGSIFQGAAKSSEVGSEFLSDA